MIDVRGSGTRTHVPTSPRFAVSTFSVRVGEVFGFLGPSGAGKSTTQKVLIGLLDDYSGEATMFDREVREWGRSLDERIGVSSETPNLYRKLTGRENLELGSGSGPVSRVSSSSPLMRMVLPSRFRSLLHRWIKTENSKRGA